MSVGRVDGERESADDADAAPDRAGVAVSSVCVGASDGIADDEGASEDSTFADGFCETVGAAVRAAVAECDTEAVGDREAPAVVDSKGEIEADSELRADADIRSEIDAHAVDDTDCDAPRDTGADRVIEGDEVALRLAIIDREVETVGDTDWDFAEEPEPFADPLTVTQNELLGDEPDERNAVDEIKGKTETVRGAGAEPSVDALADAESFGETGAFDDGELVADEMMDTVDDHCDVPVPIEDNDAVDDHCDVTVLMGDAEVTTVPDASAERLVVMLSDCVELGLVLPDILAVVVWAAEKSALAVGDNDSLGDTDQVPVPLVLPEVETPFDADAEGLGEIEAVALIDSEAAGERLLVLLKDADGDADGERDPVLVDSAETDTDTVATREGLGASLGVYSERVAARDTVGIAAELREAVLESVKLGDAVYDRDGAPDDDEDADEETEIDGETVVEERIVRDAAALAVDVALSDIVDLSEAVPTTVAIAAALVVTEAEFEDAADGLPDADGDTESVVDTDADADAVKIFDARIDTETETVVDLDTDVVAEFDADRVAELSADDDTEMDGDLVTVLEVESERDVDDVLDGAGDAVMPDTVGGAL